VKPLALFLAAAGSLAALGSSQPPAAPPFDLLITNARIVDGTGGP